ncbi:MAG: EAL domain-containing protein [Acidobacteria bacterium]|nr:EAL domain-containing protein [Acidobacteriota bacterium]
MGLWPISSHPVLAPASATARHILLVDPVSAGLGELTGSLSNAGYTVDVAATAGEALEQIRESEVELVLLGESLPGMTGLDLLRLLRAAWTPQQLPVIMLAGAVQCDVETAALEAGANDYMLNSVDGARAVARVQCQLRQKDAGQGARDRAERIFRATAVSTDVIWEWNVTTDSFWFSPEWSRLTGRPLVGPARLADWLDLVHKDDVAELEGAFRCLYTDQTTLEFGQEYRVQTPSGEIRWIYCRANIERDRNGRLLRLTGLQTDITRNKSIDWLTHLPNRQNILERVDQLLCATSNGGAQPFALLLIDLDRFRVVNESLGATVGDRVLREVALRMERATRTFPSPGHPEDQLARVHADTFLLILHDVAGLDQARAIADRMHAEIRRPLQLAGREIRLTGSIGIALSQVDKYERAFELLRDAEIALHHAKVLGRARSVSFDPDMRRDALHRMDIEIDLRRALENNEFVLYYQPKIEIRSGGLSGFEALIRWRHPRMGLISPLQFIPIAEETGAIIPIGAWALEESARQFAAWRQALPGAGLQVSVNISVKQFFDRELVDLISNIVRDLDLPRGAFCLEVTESVLIDEMQTAAEILVRLHNAGVGLMIDDFGTGYSSLNYLTSLPFDAIKIDRSFMSRVEFDENCAEVVRAVVSLAHNLRLDVIAEGIETNEQLLWLHDIGCPFAQGYYFAKPVDAATATGMIHASRPCT